MGTVTYLKAFSEKKNDRVPIGDPTEPSYDWINNEKLLRLTQPGIVRNILVDVLRQLQVDTNSLAVINDDRRAIVQIDKNEASKDNLTRVIIHARISRLIVQLRISRMPQISIDNTRSLPHILQLRVHLPATADFPRRIR